MSLLRDLINRLTCEPCNVEDASLVEQARQKIPGWSQPYHYTFFKHLLADERVNSVLVCGVYHGLDLHLIERAVRDLDRHIRLVGVDKFNAEPCADWPKEKRGMTWEQAFGCKPPSHDASLKNAPWADIHQADSIDFLSRQTCCFDAIYLDTSHDHETVSREIFYARRALRRGGLLAGDDYQDTGVRLAVANGCADHLVLFNRIWISQQ